ncbi:type VI secretion system protein ImpG [Ereboglobus sp. PH5-10]|uniref:type VI secretion system baseplate subunit TssF n=1 Tax=Ereboglobus sp. PH5-10 TaxID=2940629 RepID=UPI0024066C4B|nr:type VI secretion system baseplate subunit TssF [Ereboglobus sp. PH5-10]MDF9826557.1 type VI secretion system protein ImpG [Ereboglobus sp. PH5-10]
MDKRFLDYYNNELRHLRVSAAEFAQEFPKIAGRLALDTAGADTCPDPYVERLLEGFAYLAARVHLKLDAEFPRFTQSLLETIYPHFLTPIPSMAIVRFAADEKEANLAKGAVIPRGSILKSILGKGDRTPCTFRTAHDVNLLPVRIEEVRYYTRDVAALNLPRNLGAKAAIRIRIKATAGLTFNKIALNELVLHLTGASDLPASIFEQIIAHQLGVVVQSPARRGKIVSISGPEHVTRVGLEENEALLPPSPRSFEGYRLLREYFAFPQRFLFFKVGNLSENLAAECAIDTQLDIVIPLAQQEPRLENRIDASNFALHCAPVINLFPKSLDRIQLSEWLSEFHVVPDRNRPLDFEIFQIDSVRGLGETADEQQTFNPFYMAKDTDLTSAAYYTSIRQPRILTAREKQFGKKSDYTGTEVFISLVDANAAPYRADLRQLAIQALCTNRHLPIQMAIGVTTADFTMETSAPITGIRCIAGPTEPHPSMAEGRFTWRLISHLSLNYTSLVNSADGRNSTALRDILKLYIEDDNRELARQIEGLTAVQARPVIRRSPTPGPITFGRGLEVTLTFDEPAFEGTGVFLLASVLEQFLTKYATINSFTETVIRTEQRGEIARWKPTAGKRAVL